MGILPPDIISTIRGYARFCIHSMPKTLTYPKIDVRRVSDTNALVAYVASFHDKSIVSGDVDIWYVLVCLCDLNVVLLLIDRSM